MALIPVLGKQASGSLCVPGQPGYIVRISGKQRNIKEKKKETCFFSIPFGFSSDLLFKVYLNRKAFSIICLHFLLICRVAWRNTCPVFYRDSGNCFQTWQVLPLPTFPSVCSGLTVQLGDWTPRTFLISNLFQHFPKKAGRKFWWAQFCRGELSISMNMSKDQHLGWIQNRHMSCVFSSKSLEKIP